jgi:predicted dehydrogenase
MLRCAIVGLGRWGQCLVDSCQAQGRPLGDEIHFTHAVARSPDKYQDYCASQHLKLVDDYNKVLADSDVDAVVLATPHSQHFAQITAAAEAGKHVFDEKPFTLGQKDAASAASSASDAGIVLAVGHNRRFLPALQDLRSMIDNEDLGIVTHMEGNFSGPFGLNYDQTMWRANSTESPAGGMTAMGIHIVDALIYLGGPITRVSAQSFGEVLDVDMDDTTSAMMRFENGASALLSTLCATARQWRLQVFGTKGWAQLRDHHILDFCPAGQLQADTKLYPETDIERAELEAFAKACRGGAEYSVTLSEAVHGIAVQDAIIESAISNSTLLEVGRDERWHPPLRSKNSFPKLT